MSERRVLAGRYELRRILGRGGMAEVFAAYDQALDREVAVKVLLERFREDDNFTRRFQDEARHVARLNHPNLVTVFDTGSQDGQPFIVMELVHGQSLQEAIAAGGLTEDRALEVAADVCAALGYAHDRGLVHRDVKPGNILLAEDGTVKVTDFGIARAVDNETVTRTAAVLGTAAYLSPEQAQGLDVDTRSDLYSLGVVLYESLTGQPPFQGESPVTVAYQHVQETPRPPRDLDRSISPAAEAITMRALAKNPANRYQHATEMREDLLNAQVGNPVTAPAVLTADETALLAPTPTTRAVRSEDDRRRRRGLVYTLLAILAVLATIAIVLVLADLFAGDEVDQVAVPRLIGLSLDDASDLLEDRDLALGSVTEEPDPDAAPGTVIRQNPGPDELVEEGTAINIVLSTGAETGIVPDLRGLTESEAIDRIRENNFSVGDRTREFSDEIEEGSVISQTPASGEELPLGTRISIVISRGEELVVVPPVVNRPEDQAIADLRDRGLQARVERDYSDSVPEGDVISQDIAPGERVPPDTIVTIVVSRGPEPVPEPPEPPEPPDPPDDGDDGENGGVLPGLGRSG